jgi:alginate production protein
LAEDAGTFFGARGAALPASTSCPPAGPRAVSSSPGQGDGAIGSEAAVASRDGTGPDRGRRSARARPRRLHVGLASLLLALSAFAPGPVCAPARAAGERFDFDAPPETPYRLTPWLSFGAEIELDYTFRRNLDLDRRRDDDTSLLAPELSLAFSLDPAPVFRAYLNLTLSRELVLAEGPDGAGADDEVAVELKEAFAWVRPPGGFSIQVGRQRFEDEREWLYDEELDAIRLRYELGALAAELSVSRNGLVRKDLASDADRDRINNYILHASYRFPREIELEGYVIVRDDRDADRRRLVFLGVRSRGEPVEDLDYWLELGYVGGRDGATRVRGWGVDLGFTYELQVGPKPALTLGLALGSGDRDPDDGLDERFRQTGLQENEGDFGGSASFKYYGAVLEPELSNLAIFTVGLGVRPSEKFSLDLVYHYYLQPRASTRLSGALDAEPSGESRHLGHAVDVIAGFEELWDRVDAKAVLGYFFPGAAFPGSDGAWFVGAEVQFRF